MYSLLLWAALLQTSGPVLVERVEPEYPQLAAANRIQGVVKFTAIINTDGRVARLQLVSGHPLLVRAAAKAVRQWTYQPATRNGEAVEAPVVIKVPFRMPPPRPPVRSS